MLKTGDTVSETVRNMLALAVGEDRDTLAQSGTVPRAYSVKLKELATHLGVSEAYMPRKLKAGVWTTGDIDLLAGFFDLWPADFVPGPGDEKTEQEKQ